MADLPGDESLAIDEPSEGRIYRHRRRVQLADASPKGRLRLDAAARYLQDVSDEDTTETGFDPSAPWVVRRVVLRADEFPTFRDTVSVATWCSGVGGRWAERRVSIVGDAGGRIDAAVLWVHLDARMRPARLPDVFNEIYTPVARGRTVRAKLHHTDPPAADASPFALRFTDSDVMEHVNNAVAWVPIEQELARRPELRAPLRVSVEHPAPLESQADARVLVVDVDGGFDLWIVDASIPGAPVCASAQVRPL